MAQKTQEELKTELEAQYPNMTKKVVYISEKTVVDNVGSKQYFEITQIPYRIKGMRDFKFRSYVQFANGIRHEHIGDITVLQLRNLLGVLKKMEADGFLDEVYVKENK